MSKEIKDNQSVMLNQFSIISHELRTPMNAIMGLSEILLKRTKDPEEREYLEVIQTASKNMHMIVNNMHDVSDFLFSEIQLYESENDFGEIISEVVDMARINIDDKTVNFLLDADSNFPKKVMCDALRLKQLLVYLVHNACKFTQKGYIILGVHCTTQKNIAHFSFYVEDTGRGISQEALDVLFDEASFNDENIIKETQGVGFGLNIVRNTLKSKYNSDIVIETQKDKGTKISFELDLKIVETAQEYKIDNRENIKVAVYMKDNKERDYLIRGLKEINIDCSIIGGLGELFSDPSKKAYSHLFVDYKTYVQIREVKEIREMNLQFVCIANYHLDTVKDDVTAYVRSPFWMKDVVNVLNQKNSFSRYKQISGKSDIKLSLYQVRVLVVDDNAVNIIVTAELLKRYGIMVDTASSGAEAVELVKRTKYDLIFMDHMMPGMDGVETTKAIRELDQPYFATLPIIALTANTISGIKEMFRRNGLSDYLPKPVTVSELEKMLRRWIPEDKFHEVDNSYSANEEKAEEFKDFKYINPNQGLHYTGGNIEMYRVILADFANSIETRKETLKKLCSREDISRYTIEVHSLKSLSKTIGAQDLSELSKELERMGHLRNMDSISSKNERLIKELDFVKSDLSRFLDSNKENRKHIFDRDKIREILRKIVYEADEYNFSELDLLTKEIDEYQLEEYERGIFEGLKEAVENVDYTTATDLALELLTVI